MEIEYNLDKQTELSNCTFVKTVLMLVVLFYHCILYWKGSWFVGEPIYTAQPLGLLSSWLNTFHIYGFTLVSGYLFYALKYEKGKYEKFLPFIANKCKRLLLPYVFVSLVWAIPFAVFFFRYGAMDILKQYALGTAPSQLWFLLMLFGVFVMFFPLSSFYKETFFGGAAVVLLFYGVGIIGLSRFLNVFQVFKACTYLPLFWAGFKLRQCGNGWLRRIPWYIWILADVLLFAFSRYIACFDGILFRLIQTGTDFILHIVGALMAFFVLQKLAVGIKWKQSRVFAVFAKNSMAIYLLHQQVIYVFIIWLNGLVNPYLHAGINFVGAVMISLLISAVLMKFKWTRYAIGEK